MKCQLFYGNNTMLIDNILHIDINNLDSDAYPAGCMSEIFIIDTLSRCTDEKMHEVLSFAIAKLRLGGEIVIQDIDIDALCRNTFDRTISKEEFNSCISHRSHIHSVADIKDIMLANNMIIIMIEQINSNYLLKCTNHE